MRLPQSVVGPWQAMPPGQADLTVDRPQAHQPAEPQGQPQFQEAFAAQVGRPAHDEPRHQVIAAAEGEHRGGRMRCAVHRDVTGRVAAADHKHPLARDLHRLRGRFVVAGMHHRAGERSGDFWPPRLTVVAGGDDDPGVMPGFTACRVHRPAAAWGRLHPLDGRVRADVWHETEVPRIATQIIEALRVMGIGRPLPRHRKVGVGGE